MKIYLHIGSHKTGTTALQDFGAANSEWLLSKGLAYPNLDLVGLKPKRSHLAVCEAMAAESDAASPEISVEEACRFFEASSEFAHDRQVNLLFSAEMLFRLRPEARIRFIDRLKPLIRDHEVIVLASLRRQDELVDSLYRNGYRAYVNKPMPFADWLDMRYGYLNYKAIVDAYVDGLGASPLLLAYSAQRRDKFLQYIFSNIGVDISDAPEESREKNPSLDAIDCLAKNILFDQGAEADTLLAFNNFAFRNRIKSKYGFCDQAVIDQLAKDFSETNNALIEQFPVLAEVLSDLDKVKPAIAFDEEASDMVRSRVEEFNTFRKKQLKRALQRKAKLDEGIQDATPV